MVVRLFSNCTSSVLSRQKEVIRLGEGEFDDSLISEAAMDRAVMVSRRFVDMALSFGTDEFLAVATSATREARNQNILLARLRHEAGLDVRVISGREEARLIYQGVVSGTHLEDRLALLVDVGGGSTEIALGTHAGYLYLESLKLGSIRLTNLFFPGGTGKSVPRKEYDRIRQHVKNEMVRPVQELRKYKIDLVLGSWGLPRTWRRSPPGRPRGRKTNREPRLPVLNWHGWRPCSAPCPSTSGEKFRVSIRNVPTSSSAGPPSSKL